MLQNRGFGLIGNIQQSTRPIRDNLGAGVQSVRRGVRQAGNINLMDTVREIRENVSTGQAAGGAAPAAPGGPARMLSFQTREFFERTPARPAAPSRPVEGRIVVKTGL